MAQHDYIISNATFPAVRTDINNALSAIQTTNSGTSRPTGAVAGQLWLDTTSPTTPTLKYYDGADDISLATIDHSANTVNWLDSTVSITGLSTTATGTVLTLSDTNLNSTVSIRIPTAKGIDDDSGNEFLKFTKTSSAVNEFTIINSATGNAPELSATGDDTNIDLKLTPKGSGNLILDGIKFPNADGTAGQFLKTNGAGVLSFATVADYSIDFLVVAGGGGGGGRLGGGGGAGGFRTSTQTATFGTLITVTVGDGGAGGDGGGSTGETGTVGSSSSISGTGLTTITSAGGGGGGGGRFTPSLVTRAATAGGSGGGGGNASAAGAAGNTPSTSPSQGNNGGAAAAGYVGGGGGGAGAVGNAGSGGGNGGAGGNGTASSITGSSVTYAGGGGGESTNNFEALGGTGGGGKGNGTGASSSGGSAGTANTGGGGGGCRDKAGFAGGKGVVILSVPTVNYSGTTTGSPTVTTSGANTIMQFNGSGSYRA